MTAMSITPGRFRIIAIVALVVLSVIVLTGSTVRLTGSGLGCADWPRCSDEQLVDFSSGHAFIEQGNRIFSGIAGFGVALAAVVGARRRRPYRRDLSLLSYGLLAGVFAQIPLGGITVLVDLHPVAVQSHFLLSMVLVANATVLVHRSSSLEEPADERPSAEPPPAERSRAVLASGPLVWHRRLLVALMGAVLVAGTVVTGAGPHAGDEEVRRFGIALSDATRIHAAIVIVTLCTALALAWRLHRAGGDRRLMNLLSSWVFVGLLQGAVGYVQYFNEIPELLVAGHIGLATVLWILTVSLLELAPAATTADRGSTVAASHQRVTAPVS